MFVPLIFSCSLFNFEKQNLKMLLEFVAAATLLAVRPGSSHGFPWVWKEDAIPPWEKPLPEEPQPTPGPLFEVTSASIVSKPGGDVILPCRVRNLGDKVVSWIRTKDLHILSSSFFIFTSDSRFSVSHPDGDSASWDLKIKSARPADQGLYECQVNTEPKMKQAVMLTITEIELGDSPMDIYSNDRRNSTVGLTRILGPREQMVNQGSTITLTCEVRTNIPVTQQSMPQPKIYVQPSIRQVDWLFEGHILNYQSPREGGIYLDTDRTSDGHVWSRLTLPRLTDDDTGRYTCRALNAPPAIVTLIVVDGGVMEAIGLQGDGQHSSSSIQKIHSNAHSVIFIVLFTFFKELKINWRNSGACYK
ncbi:uncharacterized protein LOC142325557 isoform X2 [Lycorma delicatula]|uniref:uncharacterized protein LOC142325557 isoform X2 n=1 Tax=Lycorma delicatula TaxID=130591 RepID=UPI003F519E4B